jgi:prepilin-type N-terminal cleavage/methylation domain-containing protein
MTRLREEAGFSLPELLIAAVLMVVVLSATLSVLEASTRTTRRTEQLNEQQERARAAVDFVARDVRGVAGPDSSTAAIERMSGYELVFRSVDPLGRPQNAKRVHRVRYCLDQGTPSRATLWRQLQAWSTSSAPALSTTTACPDSAYGSQQAVAESVVNRHNGLDRPVFSYDSTSPANVLYVGTRLFVDLNVNERPPEVALASSVFLRNQTLGTRNRAPSASFTATAQGGLHVLLNAGGSSDPDGQTLQYEWFVDGARIEDASGPMLDYTAPAAGPRSFSLRVTDPGGLRGTADPQTVTVS